MNATALVTHKWMKCGENRPGHCFIAGQCLVMLLLLDAPYLGVFLSRMSAR
jgi:hypothetical protein